MKVLPLLVAMAVPTTAAAQYPAGGYEDDINRTGRPGMDGPAPVFREDPVITSVELRGPLPPAEFREMFGLTAEQAASYQQVFDSFTVATKEQREAAVRRVEQLGHAYGRDTAAVTYYRERLKELGKPLRAAQSKFDDRMKAVLTKEQQKRYRDWRKKEEEAAREGAQPGRHRDPGAPPGNQRP